MQRQKTCIACRNMTGKIRKAVAWIEDWGLCREHTQELGMKVGDK